MSADLEVAVSKQMAALSVLDVDQAMSRLSSTVARYLSGLTGAHGPTALSLAAMAAVGVTVNADPLIANARKARMKRPGDVHLVPALLHLRPLVVAQAGGLGFV